MREKFAQQRKELGLPQPPETFEEWLKTRGWSDEEIIAAQEGELRAGQNEDAEVQGVREVSDTTEAEEPSHEDPLPSIESKTETETESKEQKQKQQQE